MTSHRVWLHVGIHDESRREHRIYGVLVPGKTPRETITKLHDAVVKTLADASVREKMVGRGADPVGNTPEQFADYLKIDMERWARLAKSTNIKID